MRPYSIHRRRFGSRPLSITGALFAAAIVAVNPAVESARAQEFSPYRARIAAASAPVHSGPGESFYPTDTLAEGEIVDVYRQQANGWCAIRPPEGSFSWVFGRHVRLLDMGDEGGRAIGSESDPSGESLAEIDKPDVASRIGSRLASARNAVQVRLKKGEVVRIVGREEADGETWYKIAPPAGEFRWVHASQINRLGPIDSATEPPRDEQRESTPPVSNALADDRAEDAGVTAAAATAVDLSPLGANTRYPGIDTTPTNGAATAVEAPPLMPTTGNTSSTANATPPTATAIAPDAIPTDTSAPNTNDAWRAAPDPPAAATSAPSNVPSVSTPGASPTAVASPTATASPLATTTGAAAAVAGQVAGPNPPATSAPIAPDSLSRSLADLELRLSRTVAEPPIAWNIEPLEAEAEAMLAATPTAAERGAIQATLAKIDRFAAIANRYRQMTGAPAPANNQTPQTPGAAPAPITPLAGVTLADGTRYDAVGVLRPVASRRPGAPPFALVDERGQVLSFVTPTAGMDLQPLVGQRIGVTGNRGFIPEFQRAHVVAGRVAPTTEQIIR